MRYLRETIRHYGEEGDFRFHFYTDLNEFPDVITCGKIYTLKSFITLISNVFACSTNLNPNMNILSSMRRAFGSLRDRRV